jgi:zinc protease
MTDWSVLFLAMLVLLAFASLGAAVPTSVAVSDALVQQRVLPNGLTVMVQEDHSAPLVCSYIWYRVGLRNELPGQAGITHFLEHMAFNGTERFTGQDMDRLITSKGGYMNGFTSMDYTGYVETLPAD